MRTQVGMKKGEAEAFPTEIFEMTTKALKGGMRLYQHNEHSAVDVPADALRLHIH